MINHITNDRVLFLAWESPWPAHTGANMRSLGLLRELSKAFDVEIVVLSREPLSHEQRSELGRYVSSIVSIPLRDISLRDKLAVARLATSCLLPYHSAAIRHSFSNVPGTLSFIRSFSGVVFTSIGHWGTLVANHPAPNWVLNQCDADIEFWRVYATQSSTRWKRYAALANLELSRRRFPAIYENVGRVISVCEEDRRLTLAITPQANVEVIENGVNCEFYTPHRFERTESPRLLFTGTSASRNMTALHQFVHNVFPLVQAEIPDIELLVAGNFSPSAQAEFKYHTTIRFTGRVDDIRPYFDQSDVYIAPFEDAHGSKLKISEAMAMGMPIVATPSGVRGFSLVDGESVLTGKTPEQFAKHIVNLHNDPLRRAKLGTAARELALATIDWPVLGRRLVSIVRSVQIERMGGRECD